VSVLVTLVGGPADMMRVALESPRSTVVAHDADGGTQYCWRYAGQLLRTAVCATSSRT
jgi:hypothetical protein